jgi:serine/threonine-protein kinase
MVVGESDETSPTAPHLQVEDEATLPVGNHGDRSEQPLPAAVEEGDALPVTQGSALSLRRQDAARARGFASLVAVLCTAGLLSQLVVGGAMWIRALFVASVLALGVTAGRVWWVTRHPLDYRPSLARAFGSVAVVTSLVVSAYLGVFSPAPMLVVLGVAFFAMSDDRVVAFGVPAAAAAAYALLAVLVAAGLLPDTGLLAAAAANPVVRFVAAALVPAVMLLAVWQARVTRRAMIDALDRATEAMREMRAREAQLEEANRDLDFLMRMAAGRAGPYTGLAAGRYAIRHLIARGAMGEIYAATDADSGDDAAIKVLQPSMLGDDQLVTRFLREGQAASRLQQPNVVTIYEVGTIGANGSPYIAMELLRGHDLGWHLRQRGALPVDEVVALAEQVGRGLEAARAAGIVHRDLKPSNLFLAQQNAAAPAWKILDFGVSRLAGSGGTLTMDQIVGTPGYMSPEQAAGLEATHRSDIFSFGTVVYRALTGQPAFSGPDTPQVLYQVVYRNPPQPSLLVPGLPPDLDIVLAIAMAKDPADRFASAMDMADALRAAAKGKLDPQHRVHAQTLLAALPWGTSSRDESEVSMEHVRSTG